MTKFTFRDDITWGIGGNGRTVSVMTENQAGFDAYRENLGYGMQAALWTLRDTIALLTAGGSPTISFFADQFFLTGETLSDADRTAILAVLVKTLTGMTNQGFTLKVGGGDGNAAGWVRSRNLPANPNKIYSNAVASMDDPDTPRRRSAIHLSDANARAGYEYVRHTMVHEATHKYAGTIDYCYFGRNFPWEPQTAFDDKEKAMMNADSYALFSNLRALAMSRNKPI